MLQYTSSSFSLCSCLRAVARNICKYCSLAPIFSIFLGVAFIGYLPRVWGDAGDSHELARELISASKKVLIDHGFCKDESDCTRKELVFFEAERPNAVYLSLYSTRDIRVIEKIVSLCLQKYEEKRRAATIVFVARGEPHREVGIWKKIIEDPIVEVRLKGE